MIGESTFPGGYIYTSTDSGITWTPRTVPGILTAQWVGFASSSDGTKLVTGDPNNGYIYTSTDSGITWTARQTSFTSNWRAFASSSDGTILITGHISSGYIYTSTNSGVTWTASV